MGSVTLVFFVLLGLPFADACAPHVHTYTHNHIDGNEITVEGARTEKGGANESAKEINVEMVHDVNESKAKELIDHFLDRYETIKKSQPPQQPLQQPQQPVTQPPMVAAAQVVTTQAGSSTVLIVSLIERRNIFFKGTLQFLLQVVVSILGTIIGSGILGGLAWYVKKSGGLIRTSTPAAAQQPIHIHLENGGRIESGTNTSGGSSSNGSTAGSTQTSR